MRGMNLLDFSIYWAAVVLAMIILANFIAPKKLGYAKNLEKADAFFSEVFRVHCGYTVFTMFAMMLACIFYHHELRDSVGVGFGLNLFLALFWGSRVVVQICFYNRAIKQQYPVYNVIFLIAFLYLGALFSFLTVRGLIA